MSKTGIFIPCYNVEKSIGTVLDSFLASDLAEIEEILAINNCSQDGTLEVLLDFQKTKFGQSKKLTVISNKTNQGLGGSQKVAFDYFTKKKFERIIVIHGDNQCNAAMVLKNFLAETKRSPDLDVIFASRFLSSADTSGYSYMREVGNRFFNFLTGLLAGAKLSDSGCGILTLKTSVLEQIKYLELTNGSQFNPQLNILILKNSSVRWHEIPLQWKDSESESSIHGLSYSWQLLKILLGYRVKGTFNYAVNSDWQEYKLWQA